MRSHQVSRRRSSHLSQGCALGSTAIAFVALAGWLLNYPLLASLHADFYPMATATALAFIFSGAAVYSLSRRPELRSVRWLAGIAAVILAAAAIGFLAGIGTGPQPAASIESAPPMFGTIPLNRVSPISAFMFLLSAVSLAALVFAREEGSVPGDLSASIAVGIMVLSLLMIIAYILKTSLISGESTTPIALPTSFSFLLLGAALLAASHPQIRPAHGYFPIALVFFACLLLPIWLFLGSESIEKRRVQAHFDDHAGFLAASLQRHMEDDLGEIQTLGGFIDALPSFKQADFGRVSTSVLARSHLFSSFFWALRVPDAARSAFESGMQQEGFAGFRITEAAAGTSEVTAARRPEYMVECYRHPGTSVEAGPGLDQYSVPHRRQAMEIARDLGQIAATAPIPLRRAGVPQAILIFLPIYNRHIGEHPTVAERQDKLRGFVGGFFRLSSLIERSVQGLDHNGVNIFVRDATSGILCESLKSEVLPNIPSRTLAVQTYDFPAAGRHWRIEIQPTAGYLSKHDTALLWSILGLCLVLSIFLSTYVFGSGRHTEGLKRSEAALRAAMEALKESEEQYRSLVQSASDAIVSINQEGIITSWNPAAARIFEYPEQDMLGREVLSLMPEDAQEAHRKGIARYLSTGVSTILGQVVEVAAVRRNGGRIPMELSIAPRHTHEGIFFTAIMRDITERKESEAGRERLIRELQEALARIKTLRGLLPICASCKKIRDDSGYWNQIEAYVREHSEATFTHGICPECIRKLYPELLEEASPAEAEPGDKH